MTSTDRLSPGLQKAMVLTALKNGPKNSQEIYDFIRTTPYNYESTVPELSEKYRNILYVGTITGLRTGIVYLFKHGFITKIRKKRMLIYALTNVGKQEQENPFRGQELFESRVQAEVERRLSAMNVSVNKEPIIDSSISSVQDTQQITGSTAIIEEYSILEVGANNEISIDLGDRMISVRTSNGIAEIIDNPTIGNQKIVNTGPNNNVGLNLTDVAGEIRNLTELVIKNGIPKLN